MHEADLQLGRKRRALRIRLVKLSHPSQQTLAQAGILEVHPWNSRVSDLERPDQAILDLDPDEALPFSRVAEAARRVRALLAAHGLESFVKTAGGKGLHVCVPLTPERVWKALQQRGA